MVVLEQVVNVTQNKTIHCLSSPCILSNKDIRFQILEQREEELVRENQILAPVFLELQEVSLSESERPIMTLQFCQELSEL